MSAHTSDPKSAAQYLTFSLGEAEYAVELSHVREIVEFVAPVPVPSAPASIRGVINLRGTILPVADLAAKFGLPHAPETKRACIAVVDVAGWASLPVGIIADTVNDIVEIGAADIDPPPAFGLKIRLDFLRGVGRAGDKLYFVLDIDRVLSPEELTVAADAAHAATGSA